MMERKYPVLDMKETGQKIKRIMLMKGFNVKDIQEFLGLGTPQSIYHWFDGRNLPTLDNLYALSELFHMPVDMLLVGNRKYEWRRAEDVCQRFLLYCEKIRKMQAG